MHVSGGEDPLDFSESELPCLGPPTCPTLSGLDEDTEGRVGEGVWCLQEHISPVFPMHVQMEASAQHILSSPQRVGAGQGGN